MATEQTLQNIETQLERIRDLEKLRQQRQDLNDQIDTIEAGTLDADVEAALDGLAEGEAYQVGDRVVIGRAAGASGFRLIQLENAEDRANAGRNLRRWLNRRGLLA